VFKAVVHGRSTRTNEEEEDGGDGSPINWDVPGGGHLAMRTALHVLADKLGLPTNNEPHMALAKARLLLQAGASVDSLDVVSSSSSGGGGRRRRRRSIVSSLLCYRIAEGDDDDDDDDDDDKI